MDNNWNEFFVELSEFISSKSKDRSTKVGAVIVGQNNEVLSVGYNGFPRKVPDDIEEYHQRPTKYLITEHAERNAIYNAARHGIRLEGTKIYLHFNPIPCARCTRAIIQSGITEVIGIDKEFSGVGSQWEEDLKRAKEMLNYAEIKITTISAPKGLDM